VGFIKDVVPEVITSDILPYNLWMLCLTQDGFHLETVQLRLYSC
jgi:hypothetical protein